MFISCPMDRRNILHLAGLHFCCLISGCTYRTDGNSTNSTVGTKKTHSESGDVKITGVYPREIERTFFDYEYIEIKNIGDKQKELSGYEIDFGHDNRYTIPELVLESGAVLVVSTRSGENTVLDRSPPIYHQFAGFGDEKDTSVLEESGTVILRNEGGRIIDKYQYENGGDDA